MPFLSLLLGNWQYVVIGVLIILLGIQTKRVDWAKEETVKVEAAYATFRADTKALGEKAKAETAKREASDRERKVRADAEHAKTKSDLDGVYAAYRSLRNQRTGSGGLSAPSSPASSPDRLCFDPEKFRGALQRLDQGILGIAQTGDEALAELEIARRWAQGR